MWKNIPAEQQDIFIYQVHYKHFIFNFITTFIRKYYYYNINILQIRLVCLCVFMCVVCNFVTFLLWSEAHAQTGQISVTEGKEDYEEDEPAIMMKEDRQVETRLNITQHEERDECETAHNDHWK